MNNPIPVVSEEEAVWMALARQGEIAQATKVYRNLHGSGLIESKKAVETYLSTLPADEYIQPFTTRPEEMVQIVEGVIERNYPMTDPPPARDLQIERDALKSLLTVVKRAGDFSRNAKTGPLPPPRDRQLAGFHWLRTRVRGDLVVMQWQPVSQAWCHCGMVATGSNVDTEGWSYVAPCAMPPFEDELLEFTKLHEEMTSEIENHYGVNFQVKWKAFMTFIRENTSFLKG